MKERKIKMTELMYEWLKKAIFDNGVEAIDDLLGYEHDVNEEKDTIENRMDEVLNQMPEEEALAFYTKYCGEVKKVIEKPWIDYCDKETTALTLNIDGQCKVSELIELLEAAKEKFGDKVVLIHDSNDNTIYGFSTVYLNHGFDEREKYGKNHYKDDTICIYS